jgi:hypothetical protein
MKELNRIKTIEHYNFELLLKGNDLGWSLGIFCSLGLIVLHIELGGKNC